MHSACAKMSLCQVYPLPRPNSDGQDVNLGLKYNKVLFHRYYAFIESIQNRHEVTPSESYIS